MRLSTPVLILFVAACAGYVGHELWIKQSARAPSANTIFPVSRVITDRQGRPVSVHLLARSETAVQFVRESDGRGFTYPIASLSDEDQEFLRAYPATKIAVLPSTDSPRGNHQSTTEIHLRQERSELEHKIQLLRLELQKQSEKSPTLSRDQIRQRIHDCENRIIDIDQQLLEIAFRSAGN